MAAGAPGRAAPAPEASAGALRSWTAVRRLFSLSPREAHLAGLLLASHPRPVAAAIDRHRRGLDRDPGLYLSRHDTALESRVRARAAEYLGAGPEQIALTDSTTMGLGLVYGGIALGEDDDVLTSEHDYHATHQALEAASGRTGATVRRVRLYEDGATASGEEMVDRLMRAVRPNTRLLALTWVHSSTGVKLPLRAIGDAVARANADRDEGRRLVLAVDAVHALGVEDFTVGELGCDFLVAGTHKWLFGPRGTGIVWGHPRAHGLVTPLIPTFTREDGWGGRMTPGGFHSFEHRWALAEAFELHAAIGKPRVERRIHELTDALVEGLADMDHVTLRTPRPAELRAGIVCFEVDGLDPAQVIRRLRQRHVVGSTTPYLPSYARLTPGIYSGARDVERALAAVRALR